MQYSKLKTVFFGTHNFAVTILKSLLTMDSISIDLVITQPDKPSGRNSELTPPPIKVFAEKLGIKVEQPSNLKSYKLGPASFQLGVTAQYGSIIPTHVLNAPKFGILNVHTSLLPKYRGASPIQTALINGDEITGVTIMKMDEGLDTGPILAQKQISIDPDDTYESLDKRLGELGAEILPAAINAYVSGKLTPVPQDNHSATTTRQLERNTGKIDWKKSSHEIYNLYRGTAPWPGIWTNLNGKRLKLLKIIPSDKIVGCGEICADGGRMYIGCGSNSIEILELQPEGKKPMLANAFLRGYEVKHAKLN